MQERNRRSKSGVSVLQYIIDYHLCAFICIITFSFIVNISLEHKHSMSLSGLPRLRSQHFSRTSHGRLQELSKSRRNRGGSELHFLLKLMGSHWKPLLIMTEPSTPVMKIWSFVSKVLLLLLGATFLLLNLPTSS